MIKPILLYGCEIWGMEDTKAIERVHLKYCKIVLGLSQYTSSCMVYGELGRVPISVSIKTQMIGFWHRLLTSPVNKLSTDMYKLVFALDSVGHVKSKWLLGVKRIIDHCGLSYTWANREKSAQNGSK